MGPNDVCKTPATPVWLESLCEIVGHSTREHCLRVNANNMKHRCFPNNPIPRMDPASSYGVTLARTEYTAFQ